MSRTAPLKRAAALYPLLLALLGAIVWANSLQGAFVHDDRTWIQLDPKIRSLSNLSAILADTPRPLWKLSLAANYAIGGLDVTGYHVVNVAIHLLATLALYGVVRRTLRGPRLRERFGVAANQLAFAAALVWMVHPLQTQAVTYIVQRCESMMGLFYLTTLYCAIRSTEGPRSGAWASAAIASCVLGMGSKEVMVTAPLVVLLHDRTFHSGGFRSALASRPWLYGGLAASWAVPFALIGPDTLFRGEMARPDLPTASPLAYAATQPAIILHYLRLSLWPHPLVFDYGWPPARTASDVLPSALVLAAFAAGSAGALWRGHPLGFLGAAFLLILSPTSSIQPIQDLAMEHRMYLPLTCVCVGAVLAVHAPRERLGARGRLAPTALLVAATLALGAATVRRNRDYRSLKALRQSVVEGAPTNPRGYYNLGALLRAEGRNDEAIASLRRAVELDPDFANAHNNLGNALLEGGAVDAALQQYQRALEIDPDHADAHYNTARTLDSRGDHRAAVDHYRRAAEARPRFASAHYGLAMALQALGERDEAIEEYRRAIRIRPGYFQAHNNLGLALQARGELELAEQHYRLALLLKPDHAKARNNLATVLQARGDLEEAIRQYRLALEADPDYAVAHNNLGTALHALGRRGEAIRAYRRALELRPDYARTRANLEEALSESAGDG